MAEVKNAFIKSKMNKDLDSRLIPSGEYRNAINVQVSKSEGSSVGSLENALGNNLVVDFGTGTGGNGLISIGHIANELDDTIYVFLTDNDTSSYVKDARNFIISYNTLTLQSSILVSGSFLNFSTLNKIFGVNILEGLLFWTDNRNQPRKINIANAIKNTGYYTTEDQISVAKYSPYESIQLYKESYLDNSEYETTLYDVVSKFYPGGGTGSITGEITTATTVIPLLSSTVSGDIPIGSKIAYVDISQNPYVLVDTGATVASLQTNQITTSQSIGPFQGGLSNLQLIFNYNPYYDPTYNGDPNFLEDKFVRFAYRFKFEDGEYSTFSPFTQTAFTPKQDGYFMYDKPTPNTFNIDVDDESAAYRSTIVEFMENKVNKTLLVIPLPFLKSEISTSGANPLRVTSVDILYKESNALVVNVVDTINMKDVKQDTVGDDSNYIYDYQSRKPYQVLPSSDLIRVYDKVPVKAFGQEIISNRIVYSNFQNKHTPPANLDYNLLISEKSDFNLNTAKLTTSSTTTNTATIQAGLTSGSVFIGGKVSGTGVTEGSIVISFSGTALETNKVQNSILSGAIITVLPSDNSFNTTSAVEYPNHSLKQNRNYQVGIILSDRYGRSSSVILSNSTTSININGLSYVGSTIYSPYRSSNTDSYNWPGDSLKVLFNDVIGTNLPNTTTNEPGVYNGDISDPLYNPLGWYSYKIVVKQTEQEYYNVYLPGVLAGYPRDNTLEIGKTSFTPLLNDNINKIPRDLLEVGPQQKQFRSSVQLFGRVENNSEPEPTSNSQSFPGRFSSTVTSIATNNDLFNADLDLQYVATNDFYEIESNPLIAKISTREEFGVQTSASSAVTNGVVTPDDAILKTTSTATNTNILPISLVSGTVSIGSSVSGANISPNSKVTAFTSSQLTTDLTQFSISNNSNITTSANSQSFLVDDVRGTPTVGDLVSGVGVGDGVVVTAFNAATSQLSVNNPITVSDNTLLTFTPQVSNPYFSLAVYETTPVESNLDIFWETSTSGKVVDLNNSILDDSNGASSLGNWSTGTFTEDVAASGTRPSGTIQSITGATGFSILDNFGIQIPLTSADVVIESVSLTSVQTREDTPIEVFAVADPRFLLEDKNDGTYKIWTVEPSNNNFDWVYGINAVKNKSFIFYFTVVTRTVSTGVTFSSQLIEYASLGNANPLFVQNTNPPIPAACPTTFSIGSSGDVDINVFYGVNGADISKNLPSGTNLGIYEGLSFSITTTDSIGAVVSPGFTQTTSNWDSANPNTPFSCQVSKPASFNAVGTYTVSLTLSDAGPATATCVFNVVLADDTCLSTTVGGGLFDGGKIYSYTNCAGNAATLNLGSTGCFNTRTINYKAGTAITSTGGGSCCFVKGDKVEMFDSSFKDIDSIKEGDEVKSIKNNKIVKGFVTTVLKHLVNCDASVVKINGITGEHNHPILINNKWVALSSIGEVSSEYVENFYNLEIDGDKEESEHNYIIGGLVASGLGDNTELNNKYKRQPKELISHLK